MTSNLLNLIAILLYQFPAPASGIHKSPSTTLLGDQCTHQHVSAAVENIQVCKPRPVVVKIPWPNTTSVQQMTPTHVEVNRCAGSCHRPGAWCLAGGVVEREVAVLVGECGVKGGRCDKLCTTITVEEHTHCGCGCDVDRLRCDAELHEVNTDLCSCECRNELERRSCLDRGEVWLDERCQCGLQTSQQTTTPHMVVIFLLALLIVLLLLAIVILVRKIVTMRKKIRIQESIRNIQNIDSFYEFMTKEASHSGNKYDNVYAVSQSSSSEVSSSGETQESFCESSKEVGDINRAAGSTSRSPHKHLPNTRTIDEALLLLKLSTDQL